MSVQACGSGGFLFLGSRRTQLHSWAMMPSIGGLRSSATCLHMTAQPMEGFAMSKTIPLTQGQFAIVDAADYEWLSRWKWCYTPSDKGSGGYAVRTRLKTDGPGGRNIRMHRIILGDILDGFQPDHVDRDGLNNQRSNLRLATTSQNHMNRELRSDNTSGFKGVSWHKYNKKWRALIGVNGRVIHLGYFDDMRVAARAYNQAALEHFGDFAVLNPV